jgi:quercetin dioxygenase-like cupin family protein
MNPATHSTSGTERRAAHALSGGGLVFGLANEITELRQDLSKSSGQRSAKTLAKSGGLRITLVVMEANATMSPESTGGAATIQIIEGRLRAQADGSMHDLRAGQLIVFEQNLHEPIQAAEPSAFLVTVAWPEGAGAWSQEEASGRL